MTATGRATRVTARTTLTIICAAWLVPVLGLLISSFRTRNAVTSTGWWTVFAAPFRFDQFTLDNYQEVLSGGMGQAFVNTVAVAVPAVICPLLAAAFAAYAFAWMPMPGKNVIFAIIVALLVVPVQSTLIPLLRLFADLGYSGTFYAVWIAHSGFAMPLAIYILRNYMGSIPKEVMESARVDGASHFAIFWRFALPLSTPAVAAFAIFQFLWVWNDFLVALVFLGGRPDVQVVTLKLQTMIGSLGESWYLLTAGAFITMVVPVIVFLVLQRYFVRGLTAGSAR
jgi:alpha-glucoside transport system permease protein